MDWNPNQVLLDLHFIQIRYYSLMFVIAFSLGFYITKKIFLAENKPLEKLDTLVIYVAIATLLGARLGHVFFYDWDYFKVHPLEIILPFRFSPSFEVTGFAGLASHGAAVGIIIAMLLYIRKYPDMKRSWVLDRIVIAITIGGPFAVKFLQSGDFSAGEAMQLTGENTPQKAFEVIAHNPQFVEIYNQIPYRHPAQLYEAVGYFLLFWLLYYLYWKTNKKDQPYFIFGVFLITLWTIRFLVEYVKDSQGGIEDTLGVFSTGQWLSIPFIVAGVFLLFFKRNNNTQEK